MTTPIDRLRAQHRPAGSGSRQVCVVLCCGLAWPCDTIAALDALEARLAEYRKTATNMRELHDQLDDENEALQARLDAATELIRNMIAQDDRVHEVWDGLDEGPCPETAPFRAWLAGDKEAGNAQAN